MSGMTRLLHGMTCPSVSIAVKWPRLLVPPHCLQKVPPISRHATACNCHASVATPRACSLPKRPSFLGQAVTGETDEALGPGLLGKGLLY